MLDGIFELFPHPMYTVGYSHYYGYSLFCRSYTMLFGLSLLPSPFLACLPPSELAVLLAEAFRNPSEGAA